MIDQRLQRGSFFISILFFEVVGQILDVRRQVALRDRTDLLVGQVRQRRVGKRDALALQKCEERPQVDGIRQARERTGRHGNAADEITTGLRQVFENLANLDDSLRIDLFAVCRLLIGHRIALLASKSTQLFVKLWFSE